MERIDRAPRAGAPTRHDVHPQRPAAVRGLRRDRAAHTDPPATAIAAGLLPTLNRSSRRGPSGSTRATVPSSPPATHTAPSADGDRGRVAADADVPRDAFVSGRSAHSVPSWRLTTHTAPSPTASALGRGPTGIARHDAPRPGLDARHGAGLLARDPQRTGAGRDRARIDADGDRRAGRPRSRSMRWTRRRRPTPPTPHPPPRPARAARCRPRSAGRDLFELGSTCTTSVSRCPPPTAIRAERERGRAPPT